MSLINCPECQKEVSNKAAKCVHCGVTLNKPKRSFIGRVVKCIFILFNLAMAFYLFYIYDSAGLILGSSRDMPLLAQVVVKARINDAISTWAIGAVILGMFVYFTRPKS